MREYPHIINFTSNGALEIGYLSILELKQLPFEAKRCFWAFHTPESIVRGRHAHHKTEMVLIALAGSVIVNTENLAGEIQTFRLENPREGLFIPKLYWHTMIYSHNAVQLVIASTEYNENDYIRDYEQYKKMQNTPISGSTV